MCFTLFNCYVYNKYITLQVSDNQLLANYSNQKKLAEIFINSFKETLNKFMSLGHEAWLETRQTIQSILSKEQSVLRDDADLQKKCLIPQKEVTMHLPAAIGN